MLKLFKNYGHEKDSKMKASNSGVQTLLALKCDGQSNEGN